MAKAEMNIEITVGVTVRPGDILILTANDPWPLDRLAAMKRSVMARLPGLADVIIISGASVAAYRPDPLKETPQ